MADPSYLRHLLKEKYGIETDAQLNAALAKMMSPDIGAVTSARRPTTERSE